jgi:hypothetical protein
VKRNVQQLYSQKTGGLPEGFEPSTASSISGLGAHGVGSLVRYVHSPIVP